MATEGRGARRGGGGFLCLARGSPRAVRAEPSHPPPSGRKARGVSSRVLSARRNEIENFYLYFQMSFKLPEKTATTSLKPTFQKPPLDVSRTSPWQFQAQIHIGIWGSGVELHQARSVEAGGDPPGCKLPLPALLRSLAAGASTYLVSGS